MSKKKFKYTNEYSIGMYLHTYHILQQDDFEMFIKQQNIFGTNEPCNIYFILKRPRVSLNPEYYKENERYFELEYFIHIQDKKEVRKLVVPKSKNLKNLSIKSEYPYNSLKVTNNADFTLKTKLMYLIDIEHKNNYTENNLLDYEILYIGKSYGKDGNRTALDRLPSHSTLQRIYAESIQRNPDCEIWLMLAHFAEIKIGVMSGFIESLKNENNDNLDKFSKYMSNPSSLFSEIQTISFTEAALINMFRPPYNKEFKGTFPDPNHSTYKECYNLDVNGIIIETDTSEMRRWIYTDYLPKTSKKQLIYSKISKLNFNVHTGAHRRG